MADLVAIFSGAILDVYGPRLVSSQCTAINNQVHELSLPQGIGTILLVLAYMLLSISRHFYAILLTQGLLAGIGVGFIFVPVCQDHAHTTQVLLKTDDRHSL